MKQKYGLIAGIVFVLIVIGVILITSFLEKQNTQEKQISFETISTLKNQVLRLVWELHWQLPSHTI